MIFFQRFNPPGPVFRGLQADAALFLFRSGPECSGDDIIERRGFEERLQGIDIIIVFPPSNCVRTAPERADHPPKKGLAVYFAAGTVFPMSAKRGS